ncbi:hypothetical protein E2C01_007595 [Portunus trituberculatus]|uniref:Uncharacterized protein n=1 Tax=Portunus trituberculatus TaxID=210409 RepID=A0A5B7CZU5_PORTR|nr:hypothetical protein [Portunus trituberculatus]
MMVGVRSGRFVVEGAQGSYYVPNSQHLKSPPVSKTRMNSTNKTQNCAAPMFSSDRSMTFSATQFSYLIYLRIINTMMKSAEARHLLQKRYVLVRVLEYCSQELSDMASCKVGHPRSGHCALLIQCAVMR